MGNLALPPFSTVAPPRRSPPANADLGSSLPRHAVVRPSAVSLPYFSAHRREPTRPAAFRSEAFDRAFDDATLFFDAFEAAPGEIVLLGPPFSNLSQAVADTQFFAGSVRCGTRVRRLDRHAQVWLDAPTGVSRLTARGPLGDFGVALAERMTTAFEGRRVVFTMSKNNPIAWILDWVRFNRDIHGADAVLIYDNGSTDYDCAALSRALSGVQGIARSVVVEWPFKYGPQGLDFKRFWDSDFCQLGAWEHARWRFLQHAKSVMNADIDELVLSSTGDSAFERAETSFFGLVRYYGRWVVGIAGRAPIRDSGRLARHRDYDVRLRAPTGRPRLSLARDIDRCQPKWTLAPQRCPPGAQWKVHTIDSWWPARLTTSDFSFRHFREIGSDWKYPRINREPFDPARHEEDLPLRAAYERVSWDR